jgi:hypothetical protein
MLTAERLRELLSYDPATGIFRWLASRRGHAGKAAAGSVAGTAAHHGYVAIGIDGRQYYAHRLAWLWMTGEWPAEAVDHIDGCTSNNAWANLRAAAHNENMRNRRKQKNNSTGFKGVIKVGDKFRAQIKDGRKHVHLGIFATAEEASAVYLAEIERRHGEFARPS